MHGLIQKMKISAYALGYRKALGRPAIFHLLWIKGLENGRLIDSISDSEGSFSQNGTFSYCASLKGICTYITSMETRLKEQTFGIDY